MAGEQFCEAPDKAVRQRLAVIHQRFTSLSLSKFVGAVAPDAINLRKALRLRTHNIDEDPKDSLEQYSGIQKAEGDRCRIS